MQKLCDMHKRHLAGTLGYKIHSKFLLRWCHPERLQRSLKFKINLIQITSTLVLRHLNKGDTVAS